MSGKAVDRMREVLNGAGYRLTGESSADWEGNACGAGFDLVEQAVDGLLADLFAITAGEERLDAWESLYRRQPAAGTDEERRKRLAARLSLNPSRISAEVLPSVLAAAGVMGSAKESGGGITVILGRLLGVTEEAAKRELSRLLPAHLDWTWESGMCWEALDAWLPDFQALDRLGYPWSQWEELTREQLERLAKEEG